jgi:hypothetical protein
MKPHATKLRPEESETLDWCYTALTEEQIVQCEEEAAEIAGAELHQDEAAELLVRLYARMIVRNIRAERRDDERRES